MPIVLPPVAAEPIAPPATAPPTVPCVSRETPRSSSAEQPAKPAARAMPNAIRTLLMSWPPCEKREKVLGEPAYALVAAAQQEDDEQDRDGHAECPEQDIAQLAFLLPAPLLKSF